IGLISVDVHLSERVLADPYQCLAEGQRAIVVADADVDILAVPNAEPRRLGGIGMDVPCRDDEPVGGEASGRPLDRDLRCSFEPAAVPHRHVDTEREAVGARYFDLRALAQRSEYGDTLKSALRPNERDPFPCGPMARLPQRCRMIEQVALTEQRIHRLAGQVDVPGRDCDRQAQLSPGRTGSERRSRLAGNHELFRSLCYEDANTRTVRLNLWRCPA